MHVFQIYLSAGDGQTSLPLVTLIYTNLQIYYLSFANVPELIQLEGNIHMLLTISVSGVIIILMLILYQLQTFMSHYT